MRSFIIDGVNVLLLKSRLHFNIFVELLCNYVFDYIKMCKEFFSGGAVWRDMS